MKMKREVITLSKLMSKIRKLETQVMEIEDEDVKTLLSRSICDILEELGKQPTENVKNLEFTWWYICKMSETAQDLKSTTTIH